MAEQNRNDTENAGQEAKGLTLYGYPQCPFCQRVLRAIDALGMQVELRNTMTNKAHHAELVAEMGRATVPVLRIEDPEAGVRWMPESLDIIEYLEDRVAADS